MEDKDEKWVVLGKKEERFCGNCKQIKSEFVCQNCMTRQYASGIEKIKALDQKTEQIKTTIQQKLDATAKKREKEKQIIIKKVRIKHLKQQIDVVQKKLDEDLQKIDINRKENDKKQQQIEESYNELHRFQQKMEIDYQNDIKKTLQDLDWINNEIQKHIKSRIKEIFTIIYQIKLKGAYVVFNDVFMPTDGIYRFMCDYHILRGYELMINAIEAINYQMGWLYPLAPRVPDLRIPESQHNNNDGNDSENNYDETDSFELINKVTNLKEENNFGEMRSVSTNLNFDQEWKKEMNINYKSILFINQIIYDMAVYKLQLKNIVPKEAPLNLFKIITYIVSPTTTLPLESTRFTRSH